MAVGYKHTDEAKRNIGLNGFHYGMLGKKHTEETKKKVKDNNAKYWLGKKRSPETIEKIKKSRTGKMMGEKHFAWKGGMSRGYKVGYHSTEYKKWRMDVFERDGFKCQGCEQVGGYLTAHHIKSFRYFPELRLDINNGITLCETCHSLTDNYRGRARQKK